MLSLVTSWKALGELQIIWVPVPVQEGVKECGVLVCEMMRLAAGEQPVVLDTTAAGVRRLRYTIAFEMLQGRLLGDPEHMDSLLSEPLTKKLP
jgi:Ulp1 family protease